MWSVVVIVLAITVATIAFLYLDSRLFDKPKSRTTYIKTIAMTNALTLAVVYLLTWLSPNKNIQEVLQVGGQSAAHIPAANTRFLQDIGETIIDGDAPF